MSDWTNRGKLRQLECVYQGEALPTNFYIVLVTAAVAPGTTTKTMSELTEIAEGNGYVSGGYELNLDDVDFMMASEDDINDHAEVEIKPVQWDAVGGPIPESGDGARYAVLTDAHATLGSREIWAYWDLASDRSIDADQTLVLDGLTLRLATA